MMSRKDCEALALTHSVCRLLQVFIFSRIKDGEADGGGESEGLCHASSPPSPLLETPLSVLVDTLRPAPATLRGSEDSNRDNTV